MRFYIKRVCYVVCTLYVTLRLILNGGHTMFGLEKAKRTGYLNIVQSSRSKTEYSDTGIYAQSALTRLSARNANRPDQAMLTNQSDVGFENTGRNRGALSPRQLPWQYDKRFKNPCWYEDGTLKCLPYFFIIGVTKCGTTALYVSLMKHPEIVFAGFKESKFFGWDTAHRENHTGSISNYVDVWSKATRQIETYSQGQKEQASVNKLIFCDGSPENVYLNPRWKEMPGNNDPDEPTYVILDYIHDILPETKLIISFRDPVERFYSEYMFIKAGYMENVKESFPSPKEFHRLVTTEIKLFNECLEYYSLRSCVYKPDLTTRTAIRLSTGLYHVYWEELLRVFRRDQIHVVQMTDLGDRTTMQSVFEFLEMTPTSDEVYGKIEEVGKEKRNERPADVKKLGPMLNETRRLLYDFYRPYNERMAALTGDNVFLYPIE